MDPVRGDSLAEAQLYALVDVAAAAAAAHRLEDVLELAAERSLSAIRGSSLAISRWGAGFIVTLINVGEIGPDEECFPQDERYPLWEFPTTALVLNEGGRLVTAVDDPEADPAHRALLRSLGKETSLTVPIVHEGATWGELWATSAPAQPRFTDRDALTGLANRRMLEQALEQACQDAAAPGSPALLLCDIDGLKEINDCGGHDAGDRVIVRVAMALREASASHADAVVSRIGGDEFCVLLPSGDARAAHRLSEEAAARLAVPGEPDVGISSGISAHGPNTTGPAALMRAADFAQYRAKRRGPAVSAEVAEPDVAAAPGRSAGERAHRDVDGRGRLADELLALLEGANGSGPEATIELLRRRLAEETQASERRGLPSAR